MRSAFLRSTQGRMIHQFNTLFHSDNAWPRLVILMIVVFYVVVFSIFALSYIYVFTGNNTEPRLTTSGQINTSGDTGVLSDANGPMQPIAPLDTNVVESIKSDTSGTAPATHTELHVNGKSIPVSSNGSVQKDLSTSSGNASIDVNVQSAGSNDSQSTSSVNVMVKSSSSTESEIQQ